MSFSFKYESSDEVTTIQFDGFIDEDFIESEIPPFSESTSTINFDFLNTKGINSCGIREITRLIKRVESNVLINYLNCPAFIVSQMNMVSGFLGKNRKIVSFYMPYFSESTKKSLNLLVSTKDLDPTNLPLNYKDKDGVEYEFEGAPVKFFKFLKLM